MESFYTEYTGFVNATATTIQGRLNYTIEIAISTNAPAGTQITYISPNGPPSYGMTAALITLCVLTVVIVFGVVAFCIAKAKKAHEEQQPEPTETHLVSKWELEKSIQEQE